MTRREWATAAAIPVLALVGLGLTSCSVDDIDLTGRSCPCVAGYRCDEGTNTCVPADTATGGAGGSGGAIGGHGGAGAAGAGGGGGGGTGGGGILLFADEFDGDLSSWVEYGDGVWSVDGGEALQSDDAAGLAFIYVPPADYPDDVRIIAAMRQLTGAQGGALEITFRLATEPDRSQYFCNWEPNSGLFLIMGSDAGQGFHLLTAYPPLPPDYDPLGTFTMQVDVVADVITCQVNEIPGASGTVIATPYFSTGPFGLKTYDMAAAFDYFRVYSMAE